MIKSKDPDLAKLIFLITFIWILPVSAYQFVEELPKWIGGSFQGHYIFLFFMSLFCAMQNARGVISSFFQLIISSFLLIVFINVFFDRGFSYFWLAVLLVNIFLAYLNYTEMHENNRDDTARFNTKNLNITVVASIIFYHLFYWYA